MNHVFIKNNGPEILDTNYFESKLNLAGKFFLSLNAGAFRLLVLHAHFNIIKEELSLINHAEIKKSSEFLTILFEDYSNNPFQIQMTMNSLDRIPPDSDRGRDFIFSAWGKKQDKIVKIGAKKCLFK